MTIEHIDKRTAVDKRPLWSSVVLSTSWVLLSCHLQNRLVIMYAIAETFGSGEHPLAIPEGNYFVQLFGLHALAKTTTIAAVILGKDLFLEKPRSQMCNIALAILCGALIGWGWVSFLNMESDWGILK